MQKYKRSMGSILSAAKASAGPLWKLQVGRRLPRCDCRVPAPSLFCRRSYVFILLGPAYSCLLCLL